MHFNSLKICQIGLLTTFFSSLFPLLWYKFDLLFLFINLLISFPSHNSCHSFVVIFRRRIDQRARDILQQLLLAGVGRRPIVWVAHSAGGKSTNYSLI